jgi:hypothetical protein
VTPEAIELYGPRVERPGGLLKKPVPLTVEESMDAMQRARDLRYRPTWRMTGVRQLTAETRPSKHGVAGWVW